jgi:glycosyltransferase involved in cell wall biosynthesis
MLKTCFQLIFLVWKAIKSNIKLISIIKFSNIFNCSVIEETIRGIIMRVLFISSGNSANGISSIVYNQGQSVIKAGLNVDFFTIKGKGMRGYMRSIKSMKKTIKSNKYDIIHAHFSLSAFAASLAGAKPLVVSLMGSDVKAKWYYQFIIKLLNKIVWSAVIVKSEDMKKSIGIAEALVIPNGVDFDKLVPLEKDKALAFTRWDSNKRHVLFAANPDRYVKNFELAKAAFDLLGLSDIELHFLKNVSNDEMSFFFNAADVVLLTSLWEGSPNVIKEAMACNKPIVATKVGDIEWLFGQEPGHYLADFNSLAVAHEIKNAIAFSIAVGSTNGRRRIEELGLNSNLISTKIIDIYKENIKC